jgi:hypothetical protein
VALWLLDGQRLAGQCWYHLGAAGGAWVVAGASPFRELVQSVTAWRAAVDRVRLVHVGHNLLSCS